MYNLGIVGRGFVGSAVEFGFSPQTGCDIDNMYIYDKDKSRSLNSKFCGLLSVLTTLKSNFAPTLKCFLSTNADNS